MVRVRSIVDETDSEGPLSRCCPTDLPSSRRPNGRQRPFHCGITARKILLAVSLGFMPVLGNSFVPRETYMTTMYFTIPFQAEAAGYVTFY
jgi:hypothetical protein